MLGEERMMNQWPAVISSDMWWLNVHFKEGGAQQTIKFLLLFFFMLSLHTKDGKLYDMHAIFHMMNIASVDVYKEVFELGSNGLFFALKKNEITTKIYYLYKLWK